MTFPLVRDLAADGIPVAVTCRVLGFSRQAFYAWDSPVSDRDLDDAHLTNAALDVHADDPSSATGSSPTSSKRPATPVRAAGLAAVLAGRDLLGAQPARRAGASARARRSTTTSCSATSPPTAPNRLWLTDITEHPTDEGKLYFCAIKDVFSNRIVGYSIDSRMKARIAVAALRARSPAAAARRVVAGCTVHSDRGSQFRSQALRRGPQAPRPDRVDGPGRLPPGTTRRWSRSSRCCRRTS